MLKIYLWYTKIQQTSSKSKLFKMTIYVGNHVELLYADMSVDKSFSSPVFVTVHICK